MGWCEHEEERETEDRAQGVTREELIAREMMVCMNPLFKDIQMTVKLQIDFP